LYGGEEYELVLTIKPGLWERAKRAAVEAGGMLLSIGRVTARRGLFLCADGKRRVIEPRGYEHFKSDLVR
jgi:thiamine monophosphate kinase